MSLTLLDGGMGTALLEAGLPAGALPERWVLERPAEVTRVHRAHALAGARILLTCTFNLASPRLRESGVETSVEELAARAVLLARAAAPGVRVAGAAGPGGRPGTDAPGELAEWHGRAFRALARAGADLLWTESHWDLAEARAALAAARATGKPAVATLTFREEGGALVAASGEEALECLIALAGDGALAVGANCSLPGAPLAALFERAAARLEVPLVAKPSAGLPGSLVGPDAFASWLGDLARAGARWLGGCCGCGSAHLRACSSLAVAS
jgi:5-methyltetrahydrofolate--homocysteine methyltransferase